MPPKTKANPLSFSKEPVALQKNSFVGKAAALIIAQAEKQKKQIIHIPQPGSMLSNRQQKASEETKAA
jgi:hypothetical protein